jgi:hypothetical protein
MTQARAIFVAHCPPAILAQPFESATGVLLIPSGAAQAFGVGISTSLSHALPGALVIAWGCIAMLGGAAILYGLMAPVTSKAPLSALLLGYRLVAFASAVMVVAALTVTGPRAFTAVSGLAALSLACTVKLVTIARPSALVVRDHA